MNTEKLFHSIDDQISLLRSRGLLIHDDSLTRIYLENISYFRLSGYWLPMQSDKINHLFKDGSKFSDVILLYSFDKELRTIIFDAIESIVA